MIDEFDFINIEAQLDEPIILLSSLLTKLYDEYISKNCDEKFLTQKSTRFILSILARQNGMTQNDIVRVSHLKGATISTTLAELEKAGYVVRKPDGYDKRCIRVFLTVEGFDLNDKRKKFMKDLNQIAKKNVK